MQSLQNTKWYLGQESEYSRVAWFAKARGGNDWLEQMTTARDNITRAATQVGAAIPAGQLDTWAERYLSSGWGETDGSRNALMRRRALPLLLLRDLRPWRELTV